MRACVRACVRPSVRALLRADCALCGRRQRLCANAMRVHYSPLLACCLSDRLGHHAECSDAFRCGTARYIAISLRVTDVYNAERSGRDRARARRRHAAACAAHGAPPWRLRRQWARQRLCIITMIACTTRHYLFVFSLQRSAMHNCARFLARATRNGLRVSDAPIIPDAIAHNRADTMQVPAADNITYPRLDLAMEDRRFSRSDLYWICYIRSE